MGEDSQDVVPCSQLGQHGADLRVPEHRLEAFGNIVTGQQPRLVLDVVSEGDVGDIVEEGREAQDPPLVVPDGGTVLGVALGVLVHRVQEPVGHVQDTDRVLEAGVHRPGVDQVGRTQLTELSRHVGPNTDVPAGDNHIPG